MILKSRARFSAVDPIISPEIGSVNPCCTAITGDKKFGLNLKITFNFCKNDLDLNKSANNLVILLLYKRGILLIDSTPPAIITSASPSKILLAALVTDSMPEAQLRCTVKAGTDSGIPAFKAITLAIFAESLRFATLPIITSSIIFGSISVLTRSSFTTFAPRSWAETFFRQPPALPIGVLKPSIIAILSFIFNNIYYGN